MKVGIVLEGGAMRGMYTAGVLDTFLENGIKADCMVGVSAGALFGVNFLSEQKERVIRYNKRFNRDRNYLGLRPLIREGNIVNTKYAYHDVPHHLDPFDDKKYMNSGVPFYAVVTGIDSGAPEYIQVKSVFKQMDVLRASGSMPFVSKPVKIGSKLYLDGAVADSIPYEWLSQQGCDKLIVILTRDANYRKSPINKKLVKLWYRKYPKFAKRLLNRHAMYNKQIETLSQWEKDGKTFVIRPSKPIEIGKIEKNPQKLQSVYDLGKKDAAKAFETLKEYLK